MLTAILAFTSGVAWLQWQPELPDCAMLVVMLALAGVALALAFAHNRLRAAGPVAAFLLGVVWAAAMAHWRLMDALPAGSEGRDIELVGTVADLPESFENGWRFEFEVERSTLPAPHHISLAWYRAYRPQDEPSDADIPEPHSGERWHLTVRLKRPHGNLNPHGFDYEAWLLEQNIRATGYVRAAPGNARLDAFAFSTGHLVGRLREAIRDRFQERLAAAPYAGILIALVIGDQHAIDSDMWQSFARTGLTHLMSISGLHITMVAGVVYWLIAFCWRRQPALALRLPAQQAAAFGGLVAALCYCLLAGFAVPAQRTLYMLTVVALALAMRRTTAARQALAMALLAVLLIDPWAVLAAGFWLSFGAVALLFYVGSGRLGPGHWLEQWGRAQWAMSIGMLPLLLALFQQFSLVSPLANAVAIPVVSFVITPLALLAALPGSGFLLWPAHAACAALMTLVEWLAASPWAVWQQHAPPLWATALALAGTGCLLLPRGFPGRWLGLVMFLPLFLVSPERPAPGQARLVVLDVGQGLAVHVQTAHRDLVFDTGPAFSPDANSGNRIILPYLRAVGVTRLDGLVVSHQDKDHSGGAQSILEEMPVGWLLNSLPAGHPLLTLAQTAGVPCSDGQRWDWDGVAFEVLHPAPERQVHPARKSNDMSCVLRVSAGGTSALLSADIEARSEEELLVRHGAALHSDILLAPHHGSRTSSTPEFIAAVAPHYVVFPVGYRNRFGHPKPEIVERYRDGLRQFSRTDRDGAVSFTLGGSPVTPMLERVRSRRYWHGR